MKPVSLPIIHPESRGKFFWDICVLISALYVSIEVPVAIVYRLQTSSVISFLNWVVTFIYLLDIVVNFRTSFQSEGKFIRDPQEIARRYLRSWFWIDLVAAFPLSAFLTGKSIAGIYRMVKLLRLSRLLKLMRITETLRKIGGSKVNPAILRLVLLVFWVLLAAHIVACGWIFISGNPDGLDPVTLYIRAFYWTITTLTTIGYGDITPGSNNEMIYVIFIEMLGAGMYGLIIGNIANLIANIDVAKTQYREKMETVNTFLKYRNIPHDLQRKINDYYNYLWETRRGYDEAVVIQDLPEPLRISVSLYLNQDIIEKVPIFEQASPEFIKEVIMHLKPLVFTPGDYIVTAGELGDEMYFISKGSVDVVSPDGTIVYATLTTGQFFGEMALILSTPRTASIVAKEYCDIYSLDKPTFERILSRYPDFAKVIRELAAKRKAENEAAKVAAQKKEVSESEEAREHGVPARVTGLRTERALRGIRLSWDPAENAGHYEIVRRLPRSRLWKYLSQEVMDTEFLDPHLVFKRRIRYRVRAVNVSGPGPWSEEVSVRKS